MLWTVSRCLSLGAVLIVCASAPVPVLAQEPEPREPAERRERREPPPEPRRHREPPPEPGRHREPPPEPGRHPEPPPEPGRHHEPPPPEPGRPHEPPPPEPGRRHEPPPPEPGRHREPSPPPRRHAVPPPSQRRQPKPAPRVPKAGPPRRGAAVPAVASFRYPKPRAVRAGPYSVVDVATCPKGMGPSQRFARGCLQPVADTPAVGDRLRSQRALLRGLQRSFPWVYKSLFAKTPAMEHLIFKTAQDAVPTERIKARPRLFCWKPRPGARRPPGVRAERGQWCIPTRPRLPGKGPVNAYRFLVESGQFGAGTPVWCIPSTKDGSRVHCTQRWVETVRPHLKWVCVGTKEVAYYPRQKRSEGWVVPQGGFGGFKCRRRVFGFRLPPPGKVESLEEKATAVCRELGKKVWPQVYGRAAATKKGGAQTAPELRIWLSREEVLYFFGHTELYCTAERPGGPVHFRSPKHQRGWAARFRCGVPRSLIESGPFEEGLQLCAVSPRRIGLGHVRLANAKTRMALHFGHAFLHCWKTRRLTCKELVALEKSRKLRYLLERSVTFGFYDHLQEARRVGNPHTVALGLASVDGEEKKGLENLPAAAQVRSFQDVGEDEIDAEDVTFCRFVGNRRTVSCGFTRRTLARWYEQRKGQRPAGCEDGVCDRGAYRRGYYCGLYRARKILKGSPVWICGIDPVRGKWMVAGARNVCHGGADQFRVANASGERSSLGCYRRMFRFAEPKRRPDWRAWLPRFVKNRGPGFKGDADKELKDLVERAKREVAKKRAYDRAKEAKQAGWLTPQNLKFMLTQEQNFYNELRRFVFDGFVLEGAKGKAPRKVDLRKQGHAFRRVFEIIYPMIQHYLRNIPHGYLGYGWALRAGVMRRLYDLMPQFPRGRPAHPLAGDTWKVLFQEPLRHSDAADEGLVQLALVAKGEAIPDRRLLYDLLRAEKFEKERHSRKGIVKLGRLVMSAYLHRVIFKLLKAMRRAEREDNAKYAKLLHGNSGKRPLLTRIELLERVRTEFKGAHVACVRWAPPPRRGRHVSWRSFGKGPSGPFFLCGFSPRVVSGVWKQATDQRVQLARKQVNQRLRAQWRGRPPHRLAQARRARAEAKARAVYTTTWCYGATRKGGYRRFVRSGPKSFLHPTLGLYEDDLGESNFFYAPQPACRRPHARFPCGPRWLRCVPFRLADSEWTEREVPVEKPVSAKKQKDLLAASDSRVRSKAAEMLQKGIGIAKTVLEIFLPKLRKVLDLDQYLKALDLQKVAGWAQKLLSKEGLVGKATQLKNQLEGLWNRYQQKLGAVSQAVGKARDKLKKAAKQIKAQWERIKKMGQSAVQTVQAWRDLFPLLAEEVTKMITAKAMEFVKPKAYELLSKAFNYLRGLLSPVVNAIINALASIPFVGPALAAAGYLAAEYGYSRLYDFLGEKLVGLAERLISFLVRKVVGWLASALKKPILAAISWVCKQNNIIGYLCPKKLASVAPRHRWLQRALACQADFDPTRELNERAAFARARLHREVTALAAAAPRIADGVADAYLARFGHTHRSWMLAFGTGAPPRSREVARRMGQRLRRQVEAQLERAGLVGSAK